VLAFDGTGSLTNRYLHGPLVDQVLADENLLEGDVFWSLADHLGTVRTLVDNEGNRIRDRVFAAWGAIVEDTNPTFVYPYAFTGREYDLETGFYHYRARYYDPATGRFLSEDPLGFAAGDTNLARYVLNSPTNYRDPTGQFVIPLGIALVGIGIVGGAWAWGDELAILLSGESARGDKLDRQRREQQLRESMAQDDFAGAGAFDVQWRLDAVRTASGEMMMMATMYYEWAGGIFTFVTPMGSLNGLRRVGAIHQHHIDDLADVMPQMRRGGGGGGAPKSLKHILDALPGKVGKTGPIKEVLNEKALDDLFDSLSRGGKAAPPGTYPGEAKVLPDGTIIGRRPTSKSGGAALDIKLPDGTYIKVHIKRQ
jgi:RHS repeat-associated protein